MPYIDKFDRSDLRYGVEKPRNPGELNYVITDLIDSYLLNRAMGYGAFNEVIGVLECAKLELYRRVAAPYEDWKLKENGDVYSRHNTGG